MDIGGSPTPPPRRSQRALAVFVAGFALVMGACVGDVMPAEQSTVTASAQRPKDAGVKRTGTSRPVPPEERACPDDLERPVAAGLIVSQIALYQTVKIPLYEGGLWQSERAAPIVEGKRALVRVFAEALPDYQPHAVQAVLTVTNGDEVVQLVDERELAVDSSDIDLESTFNFEIVASRVKENTQISVSLEEADCEAEGGDPADVRLPKSGSKSLKAEAVGKLRLTVVPIVVDGRLPVLDDEQRANIRAALTAFYPVTSVELGVTSPIAFVGNTSTEDSKTLLGELLSLVKDKRAADRPADDVYYVGLFQPTPNFRAFCDSGCVLGLAPQNLRSEPHERVAVGAFFADARGCETVVHELGHAHGRGHSPCESGIVPAGIDLNFPRKDGSVGEWGWDFRTGSLVPPTNKDIMGYCSPTWMSPYHYRALADRVRSVNQAPAAAVQALWLGGARDRYRTLLVREDGRARWHRTIRTELALTGRQPALVLDAQNNVIGEVEIARMPLSESTAEFVSIPEPRATWHALEWQGYRLELSEILPPL